MVKEEQKGNYFGALTALIALHYLGLGIDPARDFDLLSESYERKVYPFNKEDIFKTFRNELALII